MTWEQAVQAVYSIRDALRESAAWLEEPRVQAVLCEDDEHFVDVDGAVRELRAALDALTEERRKA